MSNDTGQPMLLILEPWAEEYVVPNGCVVDIVNDDEASLGEFEISAIADGLKVFGWTGSILRVMVDGKELTSRDQRCSWNRLSHPKTCLPMTTPFEFTEAFRGDSLQGRFVLTVPAGLQSKGELLNSLATAGKFPEYFGENWDALLDSLRDFSWIDERQIVILHRDLPLRGNSSECRTYLEILHEAVNDWARSTSEPNEGPRSAPPEHELQVFFPSSERGAVSGLIGKRGN